MVCRNSLSGDNDGYPLFLRSMGTHIEGVGEKDLCKKKILSYARLTGFEGSYSYLIFLSLYKGQEYSLKQRIQALKCGQKCFLFPLERERLRWLRSERLPSA